MDKIDFLRSNIVENSSIDKNSFRLLHFEVRSNPFLGNLKIDFIDLNDKPEVSPYSTIIIGPNGTGKSNILRALIQIFREINEYNSSGKRLNEIQGGFRLIYLYDRKIFQFGNIIDNDGIVEITNNLSYKISKDVSYLDGRSSAKDDKLLLPESLIASSIMLTDKFLVLNDEDEFPNYHYLGVRRSPNVAGTRTYVRRTVDLLVERIDDSEFIGRLDDILGFLELEKSLKVQYHPKYQKLLFNNNDELTIEGFHRFFDKEQTHPNRKTELWGKDYYEKIKNDEERIFEIVSFCNRLSHRLVKVGPRKKSIQFDLIQDRSIKGDYIILKDLDALDFISYPSIILKNKNSDYNLNESSSGEYHLISTLIGILATIEDGSLVIIDEPEISLHPNWQMKYMYYIRQLFKEYKSCHFIIATHSHFLVSDLVDENSCIVALSRDEKISATTLKGNTFGKSAEEVLFKVFNARTTRNHYLESQLTQLTNLISRKSDDKRQISELLIEIKKVSLGEDDPLILIIEQAESYLSND